MCQEGSHQNQGRAQWQWQPWLQHQLWISSSVHHVWHHSHQRWWGMRAPIWHGGCQQWAWSSICPAQVQQKSSQRPRATKQHGQSATALTSLNLSSSIPPSPAEGDSDNIVAVEDLAYGRLGSRLCHGGEWGQSHLGQWWVWLREWLTGEHHWLWSWVSNGRWLPHFAQTLRRQQWSQPTRDSAKGMVLL